MPNEVKLLPCPFCGGEAAYTRDRKSIGCTSCWAGGPVTTSEGIAIEWNTRPTTLVTDEVVELKEWAFEKSRLHHQLAHDNEGLRTEHIASSAAYRELALEIEARASMPTVVTGEQPQVSSGVVRIVVRKGETAAEALARHTHEGNEQQKHNL